MNFKLLLCFCFAIVSTTFFAQNKVFNYNQIQSRNDDLSWSDVKVVSEQLVHINKNEIKFKIEKNYNLSIVSKTDLPNKGIIFLCQDEETNPVTVMLINNSKMYFYNKSKRYLINLNALKLIDYVSDID